MMVSEIELQHAEECAHPRADSDSRIYAATPGRTIIGPVIQVHIKQFLGTHGIEMRIPSTTRYISEIQDTIPRVLNYFGKDLLQKKANLVLQRWSTPASTKLMRRSSKFRRIQCTVQKELFLLEEVE